MGTGSSTGAGLRRLAKLYGMVENLHALEVRAAAGAVAEVERAAAQLKATRQAEVKEGRAGLARGSRVEAMAADNAEALHAASRLRMGQLKRERDHAHDAAAAAHRTSRLEKRQIDGVVERVEAAAAMMAGRKAQGTSDDRFLSRRAWTQTKELRERG